MDKTTLVCNCGKTKELDYKTLNAGDVMKEGWGVNATFDGKMLKFCPECYEKIKFHAQKIFELTGTKYIHFKSLVPNKKEED